MFSDIIDELNGKRVIVREDGTVLVHYGNLDDEDPRWFVTDKETLKDLIRHGLDALHGGLL